MLRFWRSKKPGARPASMPELAKHSDFDNLLHEDLAIVFKHSPACPVSWAAHAHVTRFRAQNPTVPVHMVSVLKDRALARAIAERTRVRHESPQIIVLRRGQVISVASHSAISADGLAQMLNATPQSSLV